MACGKVGIESFSYSDSFYPKTMALRYTRIHMFCEISDVEAFSYSDSHYLKTMSLQYTRTH